jgi:hypothetical protein
MTNTITVVARVSMKLWRRELASAFGIRERALLTSLAAFAALILALSLFLAWVLNEFVSSVVPAIGYSTDQRALLRLVFAGVILGTTVYFLVLCGTLPPRDRLATALALLPVRRWHAQVGTLLPTFVIGTCIACIFGFPTLPMIAKLIDQAEFQAIAIVAFIGAISLVALLVPGLFFGLRDLCLRAARLPMMYSLATAAALTLSIVLVLVGVDLIPTGSIEGETAGYLLMPARALSELLQPDASDPLRLATASVTLTAWFVLAAGLAVRAICSSTPLDGRAVAAPTIRLPERGSAKATAFMFELIVLTRLPQFVVTGMTLLVVAIIVPVVYTQTEARSAVDQVAALPIIAAAAIGAYSFGSTRQSHWIGTVLAGPFGWLWPKPLATLAASILLSMPYVTLMALAGLPASRFLDLATLGLSMWASATLAGVILPFAPDQPLSATVTSATTIGLWALSTFSLRWVFASLRIDSPILPALCWVAVALTMYVVVATTARMGGDLNA